MPTARVTALQHGSDLGAHCALVFDFGTTSLKVALIQDEIILAETNCSYPVDSPEPGWAEQDPDNLWQVAGEASRSLLASYDAESASVMSVIFIAPWKAVIPVSSEGELLRSGMIWLDGRATEEAEELNATMGEFVGTGQEIWPRLMWLKRHEPKIWNGAHWIMGLVTYFKWRATGMVLTEPSDNFISASMPDQDKRYTAILNAAGLYEDRSKFAKSGTASDVVGELTAEAAEHLGLASGVKVHGGFGDLPAITWGAGPVENETAHIYIGTSSWFAVVTGDVGRLSPPLASNLDDSRQLAVYPLQTGGMAFDWIVQELYGHEQAHLDEKLLDRVNKDVSEIPPGSDHLLATHWLNGELPPLAKTARGAYINLTTAHDRRHMVRAMMESICYTHRTSIEEYEKVTGTHLSQITCTGGGAASSVWMQILANVLRRNIWVPARPRYSGVIGGYRASRAGIDLQSTSAPAQADGTLIKPDDAAANIYDEMYGYYAAVFPALKDLFDRMNS